MNHARPAQRVMALTGGRLTIPMTETLASGPGSPAALQSRPMSSVFGSIGHAICFAECSQIEFKSAHARMHCKTQMGDDSSCWEQVQRNISMSFNMRLLACRNHCHNSELMVEQSPNVEGLPRISCPHVTSITAQEQQQVRKLRLILRND